MPGRQLLTPLKYVFYYCFLNLRIVRWFVTIVKRNWGKLLRRILGNQEPEIPLSLAVEKLPKIKLSRVRGIDSIRTRKHLKAASTYLFNIFLQKKLLNFE